jgi:hypothetical protein
MADEDLKSQNATNTQNKKKTQVLLTGMKGMKGMV